MKIYVLTTGRYSEYEIAGLFTREDLAKEANQWLENPNDIQVWETDVTADHPPGTRLWHVDMDRGGEAALWEINCLPLASAIGCPQSVPAGTSFHFFYVWATDKEHAIKIVGDWRRQLIAEGRWPEA